MRARMAGLCLALMAAGLPARAQEGEAFERVELRVTSSGSQGTLVVDRGDVDQVAVGDRVVLLPREGGSWPGTVTEVSERTAVVQLADRSVELPPGTRGQVLIPRERLEQPADEAPAEPAPPTEPVQDPQVEPASDPDQHPAWENTDEDFEREMPLLAAVGAVRPEERDPRVSGRLYFIGDQIVTSEDGRGDTYLRMGTGLFFENPFGRGGAVNVDGELVYRAASRPDEEDQSELALRVDRASYSWGGTRFAPVRWEAGRFLQHGMSEFGVLDGLEWQSRRENGDRWGLSAGFMPEPDADMHTGDDIQLAGYYSWMVDDAGRFLVDGGFQKTFHNNDSDRDLLVAKVRYMPPEGWDFLATTWVDFYGSGDDAKDAAVELTQAFVTSRRRWDSGNGIDLTYRHQAFPELEREEFPPVGLDQLADDHYDRVAVSGWRWIAPERRLHGVAGAWADEDEAGGDAELGLELVDVLIRDGRADLAVFGTLGRFSEVAGARASFGRTSAGGLWQVYYELANHRQQGFSSDRDDILQHRLGARQSWASVAGWSFSLHADATIWDDDAALQLGVYLQRSF